MKTIEAANMSEGACIKAIDKTSVHRICSGQVILSLATAVKELVENSLDAGANTIEIRVKDYGKESIEVVDNGKGVDEENFPGLTLKHHTSKLRDFSDLSAVDTFGFRGEALSSLCALSDVTITTRHSDALTGHKIKFYHNGKIVQKTICARQQGTTVLVQNLFSTLPVRHKEFIRNVKKEFGKMINVLTAYCLISTGVKLQCSHITDKGKKSMVISTNSNQSIKENITNIFGPKQMDTIREFIQCVPSEEICNELGAKNAAVVPFTIRGYVSTCEHGKGRSCADRQFVFVNKRPCDLVKLTRIVNEVYHQYNRHQYPFIMLSVELNKESVDVNVTPDKRQVFMENEKLLLAIVKASLIQIYEPLSSDYQLQTLSTNHRIVKGKDDKSDDFSSCLSNLKRNFSSAFANSQELRKKTNDERKQPKLDAFVRTSKRIKIDDLEEVEGDNLSDNLDNRTVLKLEDELAIFLPEKEDKLDVNLNESSLKTVDDRHRHSPTSSQNFSPNVTEIECNYVQAKVVLHEPDTTLCKVDMISPAVDQDLTSLQKESHIVKGTDDKIANQSNALDSTTVKLTDCLPRNGCHGDGSGDHGNVNRNVLKVQELSPGCSGDNYASAIEITDYEGKAQRGLLKEKPIVLDNNSTDRCQCNGRVFPSNGNPDVCDGEFDIGGTTSSRRSVTVHFNLDSLRQRYGQRKQRRDEIRQVRRFRANITPTDNSQAEAELRKQISKEMFTEMQILGQFNLGFIIAKLQRDLFIIDQHATDEKYNFEMLQKNTTLDGQKLVSALNLDLSVVNESLLIDNLEIFEKNGFSFQIDLDAPCREKVKLISTPTSKNWVFGKSDIDEMLYMLSESPSTMCRPSRVRQMFASRACRKSIMIGTALSLGQMRTLLQHMSEIEQPWNCPHGRPTMRHLINLDMIAD